MKITKIQVDKYLSLRSEIKEREEALQALRDRLVSSMKENGEGRITTPSGSIQLVYRKTFVLNENKIKEALGVASLEKFKDSRVVETLAVYG